MAIFIGFLTVLLAIVSILLILLVLLQDDGAEGAGLLFGSSVSQQYGARKGNIITRTTSILATSFIVLSLVLVFLFRENEVDIQALESATATDETAETVEWWNENAAESDSQSTDAETGSIVAPTDISDSSDSAAGTVDSAGTTTTAETTTTSTTTDETQDIETSSDNSISPNPEN